VRTKTKDRSTSIFVEVLLYIVEFVSLYLTALTILKMEAQIAISYPTSLALSLKMDNNEFEKEIKTMSLVKLYELGKISSGVAARLLNIDRVTFLNLLGKYHVSYFQPETKEDLSNDLENA
jgi:predicted HTH domain antitoxin